MKSRRRNNIPPPLPVLPQKTSPDRRSEQSFSFASSPKKEEIIRHFLTRSNSFTLIFFLLVYSAFPFQQQNRSSRSFMFFKIGIFFNGLKIFNVKLKWADLQFFKKRLQHRCFPKNIAKILITTFFTEHLWWLLLTKPCLVVLIFKSTEYTLCHS